MRTRSLVDSHVCADILAVADAAGADRCARDGPGPGGRVSIRTRAAIRQTCIMTEIENMNSTDVVAQKNLTVTDCQNDGRTVVETEGRSTIIAVEIVTSKRTIPVASAAEAKIRR